MESREPDNQFEVNEKRALKVGVYAVAGLGVVEFVGGNLITAAAMGLGAYFLNKWVEHRQQGSNPVE
ncbi:MAG TPA: hypothetical protein VLE69_03025 [Candidatus Saccharimonadales bacterium]|nr:hypothetical protein [Candidatus Saccharimonadales bacterium]